MFYETVLFSTNGDSKPKPPEMKIGLNVCGKALQKRLLSLLADRTTFLTFVVCVALLVVTSVSFGEAW